MVPRLGCLNTHLRVYQERNYLLQLLNKNLNYTPSIQHRNQTEGDTFKTAAYVDNDFTVQYKTAAYVDNDFTIKFKTAAYVDNDFTVKF